MSPACDAPTIFSRSASVNLAMAARSPVTTALKGSSLASAGCALTTSFTRSSAKATCAYIGCSTHSVPSWSKVATRWAGGTNCGLALSVVLRTNCTMASLAAPSFHDGNGSVAGAIWAQAPSSATVKASATRRLMLQSWRDGNVSWQFLLLIR